MWQKRQTELLREEIEQLLVTLSDVEGLRDLTREALTQGRRGLGAEVAHGKPWSLLSLIVCEAISGSYKQALPTAAALQLLMAAGDVFDDIEDADSSESLPARYGPAIATNVATTLLSLAEKSITRLKDRGIADSVIVRVTEITNSFFMSACAGQHLDLSLSSEAAISEDDYLRVAGLKSASQVECACHIGALLAKASQELVDILARFGHNLGMAAQITNDIRGVTRGSDIPEHKMTLPVIYALTQAEGESRHQLELAFRKPFESVADPAQIRDLLFRTGAIHFATVKMESYKQLAQDNLSEIERHGASVERLKSLLE
ncbi:MAG: polyprenyl synthetase family protein [Dehalococcoidia bacterium]|jgi:geranylgeranyl diphosphate synthase type I